MRNQPRAFVMRGMFAYLGRAGGGHGDGGGEVGGGRGRHTARLERVHDRLAVLDHLQRRPRAVEDKRQRVNRALIGRGWSFRCTGARTCAL